MHLHRPLTTAGLALVVALGATACSDDEAADPAGTTPEAPATSGSEAGEPTSASPDPDPTTTPDDPLGTIDPTEVGTADEQPMAGDVPELTATCSLEAPEGSIEVAHPEGWAVDQDCRLFDPDTDAVEQGTDPSGIDVVLGTSDAAFPEVAGTSPARTDVFRALGAVGGHQAVRIESTTTGDGLAPEGLPQVTWVVDLDLGTDEGAGTFTATATGTEGVDMELATAVLDDMARAVTLPDEPDATVVSVTEGGGAPAAVRVEDDCLVLATAPSGDEIDRACGLVDPDDTQPATAVLGEGATTTVVGRVPTRVDLVRDDGVDGIGALTVPTADAIGSTRVFALQAEGPTSLRMTAFDGTDLGTLTVDG